MASLNSAQKVFSYLKQQNIIQDFEAHVYLQDNEGFADDDAQSVLYETFASSGYNSEEDSVSEASLQLFDDDDFRDPDFIPPTSSDSTSDSDAEMMSQLQNTQHHEESVPHVSESETSESSDVFHTLTSSQNSRKEAQAQPQITVQGADQKKSWYCLFCLKPLQKLPRHLVSQHSSEELVQEYMQGDAETKNRILFKMRQLGCYHHNKEVLEQGAGIIVVSHRPSANEQHEQYIPCPYCYGYYKKTLLYKHKCLLAPEERQKGTSKVKAGRLLKSTKIVQNSDLVQFLETIRSDEIGLVAKMDELIKAFGADKYERHCHETDRHNLVRSKMRDLAKLLLELRTLTNKPSASLKEFMCPAAVDDVVNATKSVCGFSPESNTFANPSLPESIGMSIKQCAIVLKGKALAEGKSLMEDNATKFVTLLDLRWNVKISHHANRTLQDKKRNCVCLLPLAKDTATFSKFLQDQAAADVEELQSGCREPSELTRTWSRLNEVVLTQIIMFNRKRQGEVSKMKRKDYENRARKAHDEDLVQCLSAYEQNLLKCLTVVEIEGKRGRTVPILLTASMKETMDLLISTRSKFGVSKDNIYMFPRLHYMSLGHLRGSDCLRQKTEMCQELKMPHLLRSTKLRKQIGTMSQIVNLKENELDCLADFLGHDVRIHREFYRLPQRTYQAAKVAKLLLGLEDGSITSFSGKSLDSITITDKDVVTVEQLHRDSGEQTLGAFSSKKKCVALAGQSDASSTDCDADIPTCSSTNPKKKLRKMTARRTWTASEKESIACHFLKDIQRRRLPGKAQTQIEQVLVNEPNLSQRTWKNVKDYIRNAIYKEQF